MRRKLVLSSLVAAACSLVSGSAQAAVCGTLTLDQNAQEVIIGEYGPVNYTFPLGEWVAPTDNLGVCWRDVGGAWHLEQFPACDTSTPSGDMFMLNTAGGDDYVAPLLESQTYTTPGLNWVQAKIYNGWLTTHAMKCESGDAIAPWNPDFSFGVQAQMGGGADEFHGTPNDDEVSSNVRFAEKRPIPPPLGPLRWVPRAPGDESLDMLCGGAGDDALYGDADDDWQAAQEEHLDGGAGTDVCHGDPLDFVLGVGGDQSDVVTSSCETHDTAWNNDTYFSCADSENPIEYLGLDE